MLPIHPTALPHVGAFILRLSEEITLKSFEKKQ